MATETKAFNKELRDRLAAYQDAEQLTNGELAKQLSIGTTQVSKYLNEHPEGDVVALEAAAEDVLAAAQRRRMVNDLDLFPTSVAKQVAIALETIRKTNDVGLITGPAGSGKTCGLALYARQNPSILVITASRWASTGSGLVSLLFSALETRSWNGNMSRVRWMEERLKGSNRLLCVDNAHRLSPSGREWLFDFHDATQIPVALVGNPEIESVLAKNDQQFSRIGLVTHVKTTDPAHVGRSLCRQLLPGNEDSVADLLTKLAASKGHARSTKKHLLLAHDMLPSCNGDARDALKAANLRLLSEVRLTAKS